MNIQAFLRDIYLYSHKKPWPQQKPTVIQFPVNDVCNARCQMCNIWQQKFDSQISPSELSQALSSPLFSEVKSVGVNGGEPTLRKDLPELIEVLFNKLPKLSWISLITNSLNSQQVIDRISAIGEVIRSHHGNLDVMVSLDGYGDVHDRVRGRKGNFENAVKVIDFIQSSPLVDRRRLGCTVIKENIYGIHELFEFALAKQIYIKYRLGIPHQRLYSKDVIEPFDLTFEDKYHFAVFLENLIRNYEDNHQQIFFYQSLIGQLIYSLPRKAGCDWQYQGATLSARGELLFCAVESKTLGSAISQDPEALYWGNQEHLAEIVRTKCDTCSHDYVGPVSFQAFLRMYATKSLNKLGLTQNSTTGKLVDWIRPTKRYWDYQKRLRAIGVDFKQLHLIQPVLNSLARSPGQPHQAEPLKVLICGWYGTETLGDKAILGGVIQALRQSLGALELHLAAIEPYISQITARQMEELQDCRIHSVQDAIQLSSTMDLVVFGGGPLMAINDMAEMLAMFQRSAQAGIPTLVAGCGVGPLGSDHLNQSIQALLNLSSYRIYRDQSSLQAAHKLGVKSQSDQVAEDPAFTWLEHACAQESLRSISPDPNHPVLLLGLRDWPYWEYAYDWAADHAKAVKARFEQELVAALERLIPDFPNLTIAPFPMCTQHLGGDDRWFYRQLFRGNANLEPCLDWRYCGAELTPLEGLKAFRSASSALTMRFHSLVFALSAQTPAVAIDYTLGRGKVKSLGEMYQVPHFPLDTLTRQDLFQSLSNALRSPRRQADPLALKFSEAVATVAQQLYATPAEKISEVSAL